MKESKLPLERKRYRLFAVQLYCEPKRWEKVLKSADHYAWILHDKDVNEDGLPKSNHYHLLIEFIEAKTWSSVKKKFDLEGLTEDTTINVQVGGSRKALAEYLLHRTPKCAEDNKHEYQENEVVTDNFNWWYNTHYLAKEEASEFVDDLLNCDLSHRDMAYKYGRDYIKNCHNYRAFVREVVQEERKNERKSFVKALHDSINAISNDKGFVCDFDIGQTLNTDYIPTLVVYEIMRMAKNDRAYRKEDYEFIIDSYLKSLANAVFDLLYEENVI